MLSIGESQQNWRTEDLKHPCGTCCLFSQNIFYHSSALFPVLGYLPCYGMGTLPRCLTYIQVFVCAGKCVDQHFIPVELRNVGFCALGAIWVILKNVDVLGDFL